MGTTAAVGFTENNKPYLVAINSEGYPLPMINTLRYIISAFGFQEVKRQLIKTPQGFEHLSLLGYYLEHCLIDVSLNQARIFIRGTIREIDNFLKGNIGKPYPIGSEKVVFDSIEGASKAVDYVYIIRPPHIQYNDVWRGMIAEKVLIEIENIRAKKRQIVYMLFRLT